jgi:pimeloyl-ACP methyl ester carboxylesterase
MQNMTANRRNPNRSAWARSAVAIAAGIGALATATTVIGQSFPDIRESSRPLVLRARGSFIVGGEKVQQTATELSSFFGSPNPEGGQIVLNQMYVQYMIPQKQTGPAVVMLHGANLTAKTFETTPDGRMGWDEYFVRKGHAVFLPDQVSRGRSGFDLSKYNAVRAGLAPPSELPAAFRAGAEINWTLFRFGPKNGVAFADNQFPVGAMDAFSAQSVPDMNPQLRSPNPTWKALADLATEAGGAVLMGHSEGGAMPLEAAIANPTAIKGLILIEPGRCNGFPGTTGQPGPYSDDEIQILKKLPILVVFGDHLEVETGLHGFTWKSAFDDCESLIDRINAAGGKAKMLHLPAIGIHGNSHAMMMDRNNLQVASKILEWIDKNVGKNAK